MLKILTFFLKFFFIFKYIEFFQYIYIFFPQEMHENGHEADYPISLKTNRQLFHILPLNKNKNKYF